MLLLLPAALANPTHAQIDAATWSHLTDRAHDDAGTVRVFSGKVGDVTCFKAEALTAEVDGKAMLEVVTDITGAIKWSSAGVSKAEVLGRSGNSVTYFQYLDVPGWTMSSDRYWFLTSDIVDDGTTRSMRWRRMDPEGPYGERYRSFKAANSGAVEPPINVGSWVFKNNTFGVDIVYSICTDAGGSIPAAIQNAATRKTLPDTVGDVVREAKKRAGRN